jgi:hypothetical protein
MRKPICFYIYKGVLLGSAALGFSACQPDKSPVASQAPAARPTTPVVASPPPLVEQPLGKTDFYLSIPPGFALKSTNAADFLVYYFAPADTTVRADFTGGLYLGSQPQGDEADTIAGCRTRRAAISVMGHPVTFAIRRCATGYAINSVFDSHSGRTWDGQANAFGEAKSAAGLRQLLAIFVTLRRQPGANKPVPAAN